MQNIHIEFPKFHKEFEKVKDVKLEDMNGNLCLMFTSKFEEKFCINFEHIDYYYIYEGNS